MPYGRCCRPHVISLFWFRGLPASFFPPGPIYWGRIPPRLPPGTLRSFLIRMSNPQTMLAPVFCYPRFGYILFSPFVDHFFSFPLPVSGDPYPTFLIDQNHRQPLHLPSFTGPHGPVCHNHWRAWFPLPEGVPLHPFAPRSPLDRQRSQV